jgi:putative phosphoesterase
MDVEGPRLCRFGIIGDIHAEAERLKSALDYLEQQRPDAILSVGDIADGCGSVSDSCRLLQERHVLAVGGNHDRWLLSGQLRDLPDATLPEAVDASSRSFPATLPVRRLFATAGRKVLLCHGLDDDDMETVKADDYGYALEVNEPLHRLMAMADIGIVICGHSHRRMVRTFGALTIINAGSLRGEDACFGLVELDESRVTFLEFFAGRPIVTDAVALDSSASGE